METIWSNSCAARPALGLDRLNGTAVEECGGDSGQVRRGSGRHNAAIEEAGGAALQPQAVSRHWEAGTGGKRRTDLRATRR
jgi:hypothetical protein